MARWPLFFGAAFLWLAVGPVALLTLASLNPSVLADPPPVLRIRQLIPALC